MFSMKSLPRLSRRVTRKSTEDFRSNEQGPGARRQETKNPKTRTSAGTQLSRLPRNFQPLKENEKRSCGGYKKWHHETGMCFAGGTRI